MRPFARCEPLRHLYQLRPLRGILIKLSNLASPVFCFAENRKLRLPSGSSHPLTALTLFTNRAGNTGLERCLVVNEFFSEV